jgi:hypothetical protein
MLDKSTAQLANWFQAMVALPGRWCPLQACILMYDFARPAISDKANDAPRFRSIRKWWSTSRASRCLPQSTTANWREAQRRITKWWGGGGVIKLKCRGRKTKRKQHRTHTQKIGKPAVSADSCRTENTDGHLWFARKSHEQNEFLSCQLPARRQQMRREESNIRRNWPKYRLITNKQETGKTRWRRQKKQSSGDSAGQQHWPSEPRTVGEGNECFQSPACCGARRSRNGCRIWRLGFGAHVIRVFVFFAHRFLSNSTAPKSSFSKFPKFSLPYQWRWAGAHFATSLVSLGMEPLIYSRSPNQEVPKNYTLAFEGRGSKRNLLLELISKVPNNILCKMGLYIHTK